jgi:hypothetical protein
MKTRVGGRTQHRPRIERYFMAQRDGATLGNPAAQPFGRSRVSPVVGWHFFFRSHYRGS